MRCPATLLLLAAAACGKDRREDTARIGPDLAVGAPSTKPSGTASIALPIASTSCPAFPVDESLASTAIGRHLSTPLKPAVPPSNLGYQLPPEPPPSYCGPENPGCTWRFEIGYYARYATETGTAEHYTRTEICLVHAFSGAVVCGRWLDMKPPSTIVGNALDAGPPR